MQHFFLRHVHAVAFVAGQAALSFIVGCSSDSTPTAPGDPLTTPPDAMPAEAAPPSDAAQPDGDAPGAVLDAGVSPPTDAGSVKWNPGHYMASYGIIRPGDPNFTSNNSWVPGEVEAINNEDAFVGYRSFVTWGTLEPAESVAADFSDYDFTVIDSLLDYLKTKLDKPKRLVLVVMPGAFSGCRPGGSDAYIPGYIQADPSYGASPVSGSYGWWGTASGSCSAPFGAALWNANVMARWNRLHAALGKKYNGDPNFEAIMFQESSMVIGAATDNGLSVDESTFVPMLEAMLSNAKQYFPNTNVVEENTWLYSATPTQTWEAWMIEHAVAPGTADTFGQTYYDSLDGGCPSWGIGAYWGITCPGSTYSGPDYRTKVPSMPAMVDIEGPDLVKVFGQAADPNANPPQSAITPVLHYSPQDICNALNGSMHASHGFWTNLGNDTTSIPELATWKSLAGVVSNCPLKNTGYPSAYPQ